VALKLDAVGQESEPVIHSWDERDVLLYALGVGAGAENPADELAFTTENSHDVDLAVLPTFAVIVGGGGRVKMGSFNPAMLVHGEQSITMAGALPVSGQVSVTRRLDAIYDKGTGALVVTSIRAVDPTTGAVRFTARSSAFIRGETGFGGSRGPAAPANEIPERAPDESITYQTRRDQSLLYRLNGDRNPLHSDPVFARRAGYDSPILHGLCTYGFTGRAVLHACCGSDPKRFGTMDARFSKPVWPGDTLTVRIWDLDAGAYAFQTTNQNADVVIDRGRFSLAK
jgi:acyl dehydratase